MELLLLDKDFQICGLIDDFSSLIWNRKYYECGNFNLQINIRYWEQFQNAKYVYCKEFEETGILETLNFKDTISGIDIQFSGRFLESKLSQRVINTTQYFKNKTTEDIIKSLVDTFCIKSQERVIPNLILGERKELGKSRTIQITGDNLLDKIYELCKEDELSIHLKYDFERNKMVFDVWQGLDRRDSQNINSWAIFSKNFENILEDEYSVDETQYCNFAYVVGEVNEETEERTVITINRIKQGEERKEIYVDARDLQKNEDITDSEYLEMLKERGIEKLNENNKIETADFNIDHLANLNYKTDFDIGDKVVYKNEQLGLIIEKRIVELSEVYENGNKTLNIIFGDDYNLKKIKEAI